MPTRNNLLLCVFIGTCLILTVTGDWPGAKIVDGRCFVLKQEMLSWDGAQTACADIGGKLATLASLQVLNDLVAAFNMSKDNFVWIGANSKAVRGTYVWDETNQPATEITKDWWWLGDPMGYICVYIRPEHPYITTSDCTSSNYYLCIEPNSTTTMCATPTPVPQPTTTRRSRNWCVLFNLSTHEF
ncbi:lectin BRA-3-like [Physella acuta]|uniref:lectin BRA-3-like n=1 Tax=Physella acuta TaxID=109671 RepID=UPI0027DBD9BA|nr:lectin BRA-3-like [Physella acuta]